MLISDAVGDRGTYVRSDAMHLYITDLSGTKNVLKLLRRIPLSIIGRGDRSISLLRIGTRRIATKTERLAHRSTRTTVSCRARLLCLLDPNRMYLSSASRGTRFDWLSHQGPPISRTRYTHHCIACFALPGCIMDKIPLNIYKIYHL